MTERLTERLTEQPSGCPVPHATDQTGCPVSSSAAAFDPFTHEYQLDPATYLRWAREEEPVFYSPSLGYWVVTRYEDVKAIFRDNTTFSPSIALEKLTPAVPEAEEVLRSYDYGMSRTLVNEDEPAHMLRRRALMEPFTPEWLVHHEDMVRRLAREAVDAFIDEGRADLVSQMLYTVPLTVAMHFLGIPEDDMATLKKYSVAHTVNTWGHPKPEEQIAVAHAVGNFWQYAGTVLSKIRDEPSGHGWMQYSVRKQQEKPEVVTDSYLHSIMMAGIVAAHETTAHAGANAVKYLLENREVWQEICDDPALIPNAVEECLRFVGSVAAWRRITTADTTVGGVEIPEGSRLLIVQATANRDPRHFEDGDTFDVRRTTSSDHLTFGYGAHQCMGKNLARMELQIFIEELTRRLPHLQLAAQEFSYVPNTSFRGPEQLLVQWDPAENPERHDPGVLEQRQSVTIGEPSTAALSRTVVVEEVVAETDRIALVRVRDVRGVPLPRWTSGAHIDVDCGTDESGETRSRQYSLCGDPAADTYDFAVLLEADGRGGSRWLHEHARPGAILRLRGPRNHFRLVEPPGRVVLVAGGIGITPVLAHADAVRAAGIDYEIHYAGRSRDQLALLGRLLEDHDGQTHTYRKDHGDRVDLPELVARLGPKDQLYACGPQRMIDELDQLSETAPEDSIHVEHFTSTLGALDPTKEHAFDLVLKDSGLTLRVPPDRTVLQTLRAANIDIQSDCEEGLCGSCEAHVLSGDLDHRDVVLTRAERTAGDRMMTCCSRAVGERLELEL